MTAILLLVYNRPEHTRRVLDVICKTNLNNLYINCDGPATEKDERMVSEIREIIATGIYDFKIKTRFLDRNYGCRLAVSKGIDWFFENEEEGIILEDDCLPSQSFFRYCNELLSLYRDDTRIMCISGSNYQQSNTVTDKSYYYSKYNHCTGWASWRRAWKSFDREMLLWKKFKESGGLIPLSDGNVLFEKYWSNIFTMASRGELDSWAYRWTFSCWAQSGLTCLPAKNLVMHTGYGEAATHTKSESDWRSKLRAEDISFPLNHPSAVIRNIKADKFTDNVIFGIKDKKLYSAYLILRDYFLSKISYNT